MNDAPTHPPRDPSPETATMPILTPGDIDAWDRMRRQVNDPEAWLAPLKQGGTRTERKLRQSFRERGLLLARRASDRALRLRAALWKKERQR